MQKIANILFWIGVMGVLNTVYADPLIIAHRGNSSVAPENTLAAVVSAIKLRPQPAYIEIDLHRSADGVLVVSHDDNTLRTTGVDAMIRERNFSDLRQLDAGYKQKFGDAFPNEKLPRLEEVLDAVKDTPIGIMIECKQLLLEDDVIALLRKRGEINKHVIASFDELTVYRAKQLEPAVKTLYLAAGINPTTVWRARDLKADIIGSNKDTPLDSIALAHQAGFPAWIWTVDDPVEIQNFANAGANGIITNIPESAIALTKTTQ
ncbi:MAG: hypothetical protein C4527_00995 [Candidatus Omnitrophota bacterium]|jgi:glycerophosphoryl diester phosphodiesterase|nr:MAG: hypothetical protein C4527_00995 [Candidatus Omnitrophota bacterium]